LDFQIVNVVAARAFYSQLPPDRMPVAGWPGEGYALDVGNAEPSAHGLFVYLELGAPVVRRLQHAGSGLLRLTVDNPRYAEHVACRDDLRILGRVVAALRRI